MDETQQGLSAVAQQSLPQGKRVNRERDAINNRVPALRFAGFHRLKIALDQPLVAQRPETFQLGLTDPAAGAGKVLQDRVAIEALIQSNQFAQLVAAGLRKGAIDDGQFLGQENSFSI